MSLFRFNASVVVLVLVTGCSGPRSTEAETPAHFLYEHLGSHQRVVTTNSARAQRFFDQGLVLAAAFNHDEAIRSFRRLGNSALTALMSRRILQGARPIWVV